MFLLDFSFNSVVTMTNWCKQLYHLVHRQGRGMQTNISTSSFGHSRWTLLLPVDTTDWALASSRENVQSLQHTVSPNNEQRFLKNSWKHWRSALVGCCHMACTQLHSILCVPCEGLLPTAWSNTLPMSYRVVLHCSKEIPMQTVIKGIYSPVVTGYVAG